MTSPAFQNERPLDYYDQLRNEAGDVETRPDSTVFKVPSVSHNADIRLVHLTSILPLSSPPLREPVAFRVGLEASGFLAFKHFNERNTTVIPGLAQMLQTCNVYWTIEYMDSQFSPIQAAGAYHASVSKAASLQNPPLMALIGAARSVVSSSLSVLGGVYETPQISATSTSATLDNKATSPYFARTVPNNAGDARAVALYLHSLGVSNFGILYVRDDYGTYFLKDLVSAARVLDMVVVSAPYDDGVRGSLRNAIQILKQSQLKYFFGIPNPQTWKDMLQEAYEAEIIGMEGYVWLLSESTLELLNPGFRLDAETESDLATAIHGVGVVVIDVPTNDRFNKAMQEFGRDEALQEYYVSRHTEPGIFENYQFVMPGPSLYQYLNYDAVMAMGLAACNTSTEFFTGPQLYSSLLKTEFEGVSGYVSFANDTGTRSTKGLVYVVQNVIQEEPKDGYIYFASQTAVIVDFEKPIQHVTDYVYAGNPKNIPPLALPPLDADMNLIGTEIQIVGWSMSGIVLLMSVGWYIWTIWNRNKPVVKASQPAFLCMLCTGTFIMASAIIPMGLQEPVSQRGLDIACMATPWLLSIGFVTSFTALFSKTWRLNKVFQMSQQFRRVQINVNDVLLPFAILMSINLALLLVWTIVSPLQWTRVDTSSVDEFNRSNESYGSCKVQNRTQRVLASLLAVFNVVPLAFATYQAYKARRLPPSNFNESFFIAISLASLLEAFILAVPILIVVKDVPSASFLIGAILITLICLAILLPLFIPKYLRRNERPQEYRRSRPLRTSTYVADGSDRKPQFSFGSSRSSLARTAMAGSGSGSSGKPFSSTRAAAAAAAASVSFDDSD